MFFSYEISYPNYISKYLSSGSIAQTNPFLLYMKATQMSRADCKSDCIFTVVSVTFPGSRFLHAITILSYCIFDLKIRHSLTCPEFPAYLKSYRVTVKSNFLCLLVKPIVFS